MEKPKFGSVQYYKIKLVSGRILGPLDLKRVRLLVSRNRIIGTETAREYPQGEWIDINQISAIANLLLEKSFQGIKGSKKNPDALLLKDRNSLGSTAVLPGADQILEAKELVVLPEVASDPEEDKTKIIVESSEAPLDDKTRIESLENSVYLVDNFIEKLETNKVSDQNTVLFQRSASQTGESAKRKNKFKELFKVIGLGLSLGAFGYDSFLSEPVKPPIIRAGPVHPQLPSYIQGQSDPKKSMEIYNEALKKDYLADTVTGYRAAAEKFRKSASWDITNVKALALLASSYLNLIDSSNKDENYFSVMKQLIDMSRAKAVDLPETVIADVEFYLVVNKAEAAQNRIVEYTKSHQNFGLEMFYYLALAFFERGDTVNAARYLGQFPDNKVFSAKIFCLRGAVAEKLKDYESAMLEYKKAVQFNPQHSKSHLRIAFLLNKKGAIKESSADLEFLINHVNDLAPHDLGLAYYLHAQLAELFRNWSLALGDVERAVKLDPDNHDYLLELYTLRAKQGESLKTAQKLARMYYFLGEGEKLVQIGKYQESLVPFLQARQENDLSPLPLVKMGDMFSNLHDVENAKENYKLAAIRAPDSIQVWSKYIKTLIQSYEWDEAKLAMDKFRKFPVSQSSIDKAAADMYEKQGRHVEAQTYYRKAMGRETIDPEVYIAYAKSLMSSKNFKDAPFFFALALRFDPLNVDAIINTAKCISETESIDRAISKLQDELQKNENNRAEYLAAIAEFEIQKGAWDLAKQNVEQAMLANPDYAYSWKLQAQIYMNREGLDKKALDNALLSYKSYSERNISDPSGYLERYKIFIKKTEFEKSKEELNKIYTIYPKYPNLHYYLGALYSIQGNHKVAADEFKLELNNNPNNPQTLLAYGKELLENDYVDSALTQFTQAMQFAPRSADAKHYAAWASYRLKRYQAAVALMRAAIVMDAANPLLHKRMGMIYRDMGDPAGACASFRKYLEMEPDAADKSEFQNCF